MLYDSWDNRAFHVIVADPGAGKTISIRDLQKRAGGRSVLAVVAPKNMEDEQALGDQFFSALGLPRRVHWRTRKPKLMGHLHQYGTEFLIVDDAHDLSMPHLMLLKEVTDQGKLQYDHLLGVCLVAAGRGNTIPLKEILDQPEPTWLQWRRRRGFPATVLPHCQPHLRRSPRHPGYPGADLPATLTATQLTPMDKFDLRVANATSPRPNPLRPRDNGQPDEARDRRSGMVV